MFILNAERDHDPVGSFQRYKEYLQDNQCRFPKSAYALANSDWYMNFTVHKCPHDAWLESIRINESSSGENHEERGVSITIRLLSAYHDGYIEFHYSQVFEYKLHSFSLSRGHRDWRYDEFRVDDENRLVHEIEWSGPFDTGSWLIVASDVEFKWMPSTSQ